MIKRLLLPLMVLLAGAFAPAFAQEATKNIVNPYEDTIPEMKPLTEEDVRAIFGSMIEERLAPLRDADASHEARLAKLEAFMTSGGRVSSGGGGSTGNVTRNVYQNAPAVRQSAVRHLTFPGTSIEAHLREHGYYTPSMTDEQRLSFHDSLHPEELAKLNSMRAAVTYSQPVQSQAQVQYAPQVSTSYSKTVTNPFRSSTTTSESSCPGGVCPMPQSRAYSPRARLFGR